MTIWCVARLRPAKRRLVRKNPEYHPVKRRAGTVLRPLPGTGTPVFSQQVVLERMGFQVYMPAQHEWRIVNRYTKEKEQMPVQRLPGWAFIGFDASPRWDMLMRSGMVAFFGMMDSRPVLLSDTDMMQIRQKFGDISKPVVEKYMRSHAEFSEGDRVALAGDPFGGLEFTVKEIRGEVTVIVAEFMGAHRDIVASTWELRKTG